MISDKASSSTTYKSYLSNVTGDPTRCTGYYDALYYPNREDTSNLALGYWLSSASGGGSSWPVYGIDNNGKINGEHISYRENKCCVRPVVKISKVDFNEYNEEGIVFE